MVQNKKAQANGLHHNKEQLKADEKYLEENPDLTIKPTKEETLKVDKVGKARAGEVKADEFADTYTANLKSLEDGYLNHLKHFKMNMQRME